MRIIVTGASRCGTTITGDIIGSHPSVYMARELRLYDLGYVRNTFQQIVNKELERPGYHRIKINTSTFVSECESVLTKNTPNGRIQAAEKILFGQSLHVGDKGGATSSTLRKMTLPYKLIIVYRDGRDVAASGVRLGYTTKLGYGKPPYSISAEENALAWARALGAMLGVVDAGLVSDYLILKFEDYPDKNIEKLSNYLGLDLNLSSFDLERAHIGYYKELYPEWVKTFPKPAKDLLCRLKYI